MRAPVPEDKRSTFTSRGYMTGYTIDPRIGSTSPSLADRATTHGYLVRCDKTNVPNAQSDSTGAFDVGYENIVYEGRRIYITLRLPEMFMHITRDHMSRKS